MTAAAGASEWIRDGTALRQVEAVAAALLERRTLSGAEVQQVMADMVAEVGP